jgi:hypothetical protein
MGCQQSPDLCQTPVNSLEGAYGIGPAIPSIKSKILITWARLHPTFSPSTFTTQYSPKRKVEYKVILVDTYQILQNFPCNLSMKSCVFYIQNRLIQPSADFLAQNFSGTHNTKILIQSPCTTAKVVNPDLILQTKHVR